MNVYARTTVTRSLIEIGEQGNRRVAWLEGRPVRWSTVGPWTFVGSAPGFTGARALVRLHADRDRRAACTQPIALGRAYDVAASSVFVGSEPRSHGSAAEALPPDDPRASILRWFAYMGGLSGWTRIDGV